MRIFGSISYNATIKVGLRWRIKPKLFLGRGICPFITMSILVFWNIVNRKCKINFPKSGWNHYSDPIKEGKFGHPYEMKNCREGQNRALDVSYTSWHTLCLIHVLFSIATFFNNIWRYECVRMPSVCIRPYFYIPYNFSFHKDVRIFPP